MTRKWRPLALVIAFAIGCGSGEETPVSASPVVRDGPTEVEMVAAMEAHYSATILAHDALIQGDLEAFRRQLAVVESHELPPDSPESWRPFDEALRAAARTAAGATDLDSAASTLAGIALACGSCHQAVGTGPIYPAPAPRDATRPLQEAMREHQWASERLWEGITGPWDVAWERGSAVLAETRALSESATAPDEVLLAREAELRSLGETAKSTTALADRAELYGRLLATCAVCHGSLEVKLPAYK